MRVQSVVSIPWLSEAGTTRALHPGASPVGPRDDGFVDLNSPIPLRTHGATP